MSTESTDEPTYFPGRRALADTELLLLGGYAPLDGFLGADDVASVRSTRTLADGRPWPLPIVLHVPDELAEAAPPGSAIVLTDAEGAPVACLAVRERWQDAPHGWALAGPVSARGALERGPFRQLRRSAADTRALLAGGRTLALPVDAALHRADVAALAAAAAGDTVLLLPLLDTEPGGLDPARLVRATQYAADELSGAVVVPVPWSSQRGDPEGDTLLREQVARAFGADRVLAAPVPVGDRLTDDEIDARLAAGEPFPDGHTAAGVERELRAAFPPQAQRGFTVFFTGLSGSGKSTVAHRLSEMLTERTLRTVTLLDGDEVRRMLSSGLGFSRADRDLNIRRIGWVAAEISRHGGIAICAPIAPYAATRAQVRELVEAAGEFVLVHISTPLAECERRDRKGLYAKARAGLITEFTGISDPYEEPDDADLALDTTQMSAEEAAERVLSVLAERNLVPEQQTW